MSAIFNTSGLAGSHYASLGEQFPDPFCDMASLAMPRTIREANFWTEFILLANGPYREALSRVISYFLTQIEIVSTSGNRLGRKEKKKYEDYLNDGLGIQHVLQQVALNRLGYGNSFTSLIQPFRRYLSCGNPECQLELPLKQVYNNREFAFQWTSACQFQARCPHCRYNGPWRHLDRRSSDPLQVKHWSPHEIDILWEPTSEERGYIWRIPDVDRSQIRQGHLFHLERTRWEVVEAIRDNRNILFDNGEIYHLFESTFAGVRANGWGISRVLTNFRQAWYLQVLHRYNEAIALDYVIPFRVLTPEVRNGAQGDIGDPALSINMGDFTSRVERMLALRRQDPARWNVLPFPLAYKALGGDAKQLAPKELLDQGLNTLLNAAGVPVELYNASLSVQAAPAALRLFEANWSHLIHDLNRFLARIVDKIGQILNWEPVTARLTPVRHADDLNRQMAKLQLMMGGQISRTTGLENLGMDIEEEERRKLEEEELTAEITADAQKEMEQAAMMDDLTNPSGSSSQAPPAGAPGQAPPGAQAGPIAPPPGPMGQPSGPYGASQAFAAGQPIMPNKPESVEAWQQMAQTIASTLITYPDSQRQSALIQLKGEDSTMHSLVTAQLKEIYRDAENKGKEVILQQQYGKQAAAVRPRPKAKPKPSPKPVSPWKAARKKAGPRALVGG